MDGLGSMWFSKCQFLLLLLLYPAQLWPQASSFLTTGWMNDKSRKRIFYTVFRIIFRNFIEHFTLARTHSHVSTRLGNIRLNKLVSIQNFHGHRYREELLKIKLTISVTVSRNLQISKCSCQSQTMKSCSLLATFTIYSKFFFCLLILSASPLA